jgi:hypothetical protein
MHIEPNQPVHDWPLALGEPGREVWYSLVSPPDGSVAFWYRYTLLSTEGGHREGRLWAALTDRETPSSSTFASASVDPADVETTSDPFGLQVGDGHLTSSSATGSVGDISWSLDYDPDVVAFTPLRSQRLTDLLFRVAGTGKHWSRNQSVSMSGEVTVGDRTVDLADAPGHQGHTVTQVTPPDDWTWVQCNDFAENDTAVLEALRLDDKLSVCLRIDGEVYPLNRVRDVHPLSPWANELEHDEVGTWQFQAAGEGVELRVTVEAPPDCWQHVTYKVPDDSLRYNAHCSLSSVTVTYSHDGDEMRRLTSDAGRAEWVGARPPRESEDAYRPEW